MLLELEETNCNFFGMIVGKVENLCSGLTKPRTDKPGGLPLQNSPEAGVDVRNALTCCKRTNSLTCIHCVKSSLTSPKLAFVFELTSQHANHMQTVRTHNEGLRRLLLEYHSDYLALQ